MMGKVQALIDEVWEDTCFHSNPQHVLGHVSFQELLQFPVGELTPVLIDLLWHDPNWIILRALYELHGEDGPRIPVGDHGRFHQICGHWVKWATERGYVGDIKELTHDDARPGYTALPGS